MKYAILEFVLFLYSLGAGIIAYRCTHFKPFLIVAATGELPLVLGMIILMESFH